MKLKVNQAKLADEILELIPEATIHQQASALTSYMNTPALLEKLSDQSPLDGRSELDSFILDSVAATMNIISKYDEALSHVVASSFGSILFALNNRELVEPSNST